MLLLRTHILFMGVLLLLPLSLYGQGWEQTYGGSAYDTANDILPAPNGGFYLLGSTRNTSNGDSDVLLIKTRPDGETEWSKRIGNSSWHDYGQSLQYTSDSNLIIAGNATEETRVQVIKTDLQGHVIWSKRSSRDSVYARSITELSSGDFLVSGNHYLERIDSNNVTSIDTDVFVYKISADGFELGDNTFGGIYPEDGFAVLESTPGKALVVGYTRSYGAGGFDIYLLEIDAQNDNLNLIDSITYGTEFEELGYAFASTNDGGYIISGQQDLNDASSENFFLLKLTSDLTEEWLKPIALPGLETARAVTQSPAGAFLMAGEVRNSTSSNRDPLMIKTDSDGNLLWTKRYGGVLGDGALAITNCPDEAFALAGYFSIDEGNVDAYLIRSDSNGVTYAAVIYGNVYTDLNLDCAKTPDEEGIPEWVLSATGNITRHAMTDSAGNYEFRLDTGSYEIQVYPANSYWEPCEESVNVSLYWSMDSVEVDFPIQPEITCPLLSVNISTPFIRRCFANTYTLQYCNTGTEIAEDAFIEVQFDPHFQISSASVPYTENGNLLNFQVGDVDLFECGTIQIYTILDASPNCDSTYTGQTHCVEAHIYPDSLCQPIDPDWDGSSIEVDASCEGDSLQFTVTNVGDGDMSGLQRYVIIEDYIVTFTGDFDLDALSDTTFTIPANGSTFRFEAEQSLGHPGENEPSISVEGCGLAPFSTGHLIQLPQNDGNPFIDIDCQESIGSYDPNDKQAFPKGYDDEHFIFANTDLEYLIRFQNTGSDTAFRVIIRDTLSFDLDITSVQAGVGSHPYTFNIYDERVLKFTFDNINLPDSAANELESHGFIKFKVSQKVDNPLGTLILNKAGIYFDYNEPVITNETFHLVGQDFIPIDVTGVNPPPSSKASIKFHPNPFTEHITFELSNLDISPVQKLQFSLYDLNGRLLRKEFFQGHSFTFYSKNLATGLYPFRIETQDGLIYNGKLVIDR